MGNDRWKSQPKKMDEKTITVIAIQLAKLADTQKRAFSVVFHGGEPLLVGANRFEFICRTLRKILPGRCALYLQTNGMLLSDGILKTCLINDVGISISIDGPMGVHDARRLDKRRQGSHGRVLEGIRRLLSYPELLVFSPEC